MATPEESGDLQAIVDPIQTLNEQLKSASTLDDLNTAVRNISDYKIANPTSTEANNLEILAKKAQTAWTNAVSTLTGYPTNSDSINEIRQAAGYAAAQYIINDGTDDNQASTDANAAAEQKALELLGIKLTDSKIEDETTLTELDKKINTIKTYINNNFSSLMATNLTNRLNFLRSAWDQAMKDVTSDIDNAYPDDSADLDEIKTAARLAVFSYVNEGGSDIQDARKAAKGAADQKAIELGYNSPGTGDDGSGDDGGGDELDTPGLMPGDESDEITIIPNIQSNSYYQNYNIKLDLTAEDFNLPFGTDLAEMIQKIEQKFIAISKGTTINSNFTTSVNIPNGLKGWVTLFILQLTNYFDISLKRIYNVSVNENRVSKSDSSVINIGPIGITTPNNSTKTDSIRVEFNINNIPDMIPKDNDFLSAVVVGTWIANYFKGFDGAKSNSPYVDNKSASPFPVTVIQPPIPGMRRKQNPTMNTTILGKPNMTNYIPDIITPTIPPNIFSPGPQILRFSSQINNIFKKRNNKKVREHFDGKNTVIGRVIYETDPNNISPILVAPSGYINNNFINFELNFRLNETDFNTSKSELLNIWNRMKKYIPNTNFTLFGAPSFLSPGTTSTGSESGFIEQFLDVYSKILQVSDTRFTNIRVLPNGQEYIGLAQPTNVEYFDIKVVITNNISPPYQKNDFLSAHTIGTWLMSYWRTFTPNLTELPPFIPVPVQTTPANPILGTTYDITLDPTLPGTTKLSLYETTMVNPVSTFIGGVDKSIDIIKLTSRIKNLSSPYVKTVSKHISEHFSSNNKLLEHATNKYSILDYIFQFSYITCFFAAVILSVSQLIGWDVIVFVFNDTFANWLHVYIGICSIVALFSWFNTSIWYLNTDIINSSNVAPNISRSQLF